jgi:hypothetical membrane protein
MRSPRGFRHAASMTTTRERASRTLCRIGSTAAVIYFGTQVVVGFMTDGYSFLRDTASELGQEGAPHATWFGVGAVSTGIATIAAALGLVLMIKPHVALRIVGAVALTSAGLASIAAGVYPMPDSRHGGGAIGAGLFLLPFLLVAVTWSSAPRWARAVLLGGAVWFVIAGVVMSGSTPIDQTTYEGICQRFLAVPTFGAISLSAYLLGQSRRAAIPTG